MAFWDTSGIIALCGATPETGWARGLANRYGRLIVWWGTPVETRSGLARLLRSGRHSRAEHAQALARLGAMRMQWDEIVPGEHLRGLAESFPERFGLRAGDAFQLAAALVWCDERPRRRPFITLDERLGRAAIGLGFSVGSGAS